MWRWINPDNCRYYQANLELDLLGDWTLVCAWGGLGTRHGNHGITGVSCYAQGLRKIGELDAYRYKRGYVRVFSFANWAFQVAEMRDDALVARLPQSNLSPEATQLELL